MEESHYYKFNDNRWFGADNSIHKVNIYVMVLKDTSGKQILIAAIIVITLQSGIVAGIALHNYRISSVERRVDFVSKNFVPMFFLEGMAENSNYQIKELVAHISGNDAEVDKINEKYLSFQKMMINSLIQLQGGVTNVARGELPMIDSLNFKIK